MIIPADSTLLFIGDSITDCGRDWPVGEGGGLGDGYVSLVAAELARAPVRVLNTGISGNRVPDLAARWDADVTAHQPDWLSVKIGINDVWCQFDRAADPGQVSIGRFESLYRSLLEQTRPQLDGLILMTPYLIEANREDPLRRMMDEYGGVVRRLAGEFDARLVDVQAAFDEYLADHRAGSLADDRVHPNRAGHQIIARAFLAGIGAG